LPNGTKIINPRHLEPGPPTAVSPGHAGSELGRAEPTSRGCAKFGISSHFRARGANAGAAFGTSVGRPFPVRVWSSRPPEEICWMSVPFPCARGGQSPRACEQLCTTSLFPRACGTALQRVCQIWHTLPTPVRVWGADEKQTPQIEYFESEPVRVGLGNKRQICRSIAPRARVGQTPDIVPISAQSETLLECEQGWGRRFRTIVLKRWMPHPPVRGGQITLGEPITLFSASLSQQEKGIT